MGGGLHTASHLHCSCGRTWPASQQPGHVRPHSPLSPSHPVDLYGVPCTLYPVLNPTSTLSHSFHHLRCAVLPCYQSHLRAWRARPASPHASSFSCALTFEPVVVELQRDRQHHRDDEVAFASQPLRHSKRSRDQASPPLLDALRPELSLFHSLLADAAGAGAWLRGTAVEKPTVLRAVWLPRLPPATRPAAVRAARAAAE